jgi:hypothetical protein
MKEWIEQTDDRESADDSLMILCLPHLKSTRKIERLLIFSPPSIACQSLVRFLNVLLLNLKEIVAWYGCEFRHERELKGELL